MTGVLTRRRPCEDTDTQGGCPVKTEGWSDASTSQGVPKIAGKPPEARIPPEVSEGAWPF